MTVTQIETLKAIEEQIKALEAEADRIKNEIKKEMGNDEHREIGGYSINYPIVISERLDSKAVKANCPMIWAQYKTENITRRLVINVLTNR